MTREPRAEGATAGGRASRPGGERRAGDPLRPRLERTRLQREQAELGPRPLPGAVRRAGRLRQPRRAPPPPRARCPSGAPPRRPHGPARGPRPARPPDRAPEPPASCSRRSPGRGLRRHRGGTDYSADKAGFLRPPQLSNCNRHTAAGERGPRFPERRLASFLRPPSGRLPVDPALPSTHPPQPSEPTPGDWKRKAKGSRLQSLANGPSLQPSRPQLEALPGHQRWGARHPAEPPGRSPEAAANCCSAERRGGARAGAGQGGGRVSRQGGLRRPREPSCPRASRAPRRPGACSRTPSLTWGHRLAAGREPPPRGCSGGCRRRGVKGPETEPRRRRRRRRRRFGELSSQPIAREAGDVRQPPPGLRATPQAPTPPSYPNTPAWPSAPRPHTCPDSLCVPARGHRPGATPAARSEQPTFRPALPAKGRSFSSGAARLLAHDPLPHGPGNTFF
ncbi:translation initiation factor IF-2-like [Prionailurus bengalensis]|uniref:translation initiation factor IF-2-like n=1 Tax=Prionailurus bengalensis TaxID=37029 RepID=UPI001CA862A3|nr:translation initiation factor IF-2-like [Prionailurus bengalensis]